MLALYSANSYYAQQAKAMTEGTLSRTLLVGSKTKTSDEKIGNSKTQGAQKQRHPMKKEATQKHKGLKNKDLR
jgi:hypothetical protein